MTLANVTVWEDEGGSLAKEAPRISPRYRLVAPRLRALPLKKSPAQWTRVT